MKNRRPDWWISLAVALLTTTNVASESLQPDNESAHPVAGSAPVEIGGVEARAYADVRIGNPRTGVLSVDLDFHRRTGNLFAAVAWGNGWSMNISTDGGASRQETYFHSVQSEISMRVGGEYAWVAYAPDSPTSPEAYGADLSVRSPFGTIVTYNLEEGAFDGVHFRHRRGHGTGPFDPAVAINEVDAASALQTTVEWLGAHCVSSYGVVYLSGGDFIPYFDLVTPRWFFCNGFESGSTGSWSTTTP